MPIQWKSKRSERASWKSGREKGRGGGGGERRPAEAGRRRRRRGQRVLRKTFRRTKAYTESATGGNGDTNKLTQSLREKKRKRGREADFAHIISIRNIKANSTGTLRHGH